MGIVDLAFMQGYIRMATDGVNMGWHERNGGNLTYRLTKEEVEQAHPYFTDGKPWVEIGVEVKNLAGEYFLATGTGKFLRNVQLAPQDNVCIAEIDVTGTKYRIVWGLEKGGAPTSEFPSHLMNHSVKFDVTGGKHRVIYHAHTPAVIAMTNVLELDDVKWTRALWSAMTECPVVFPGGVGVLPWMVCGGAEIAKATSELMKQYDVAIWAFHGTFASGESFDTTFGLMHCVEKAADIYMRVQAAGGAKQTMQTQNFIDIAALFGLTLPEKFLKD